ncbi:ArsR/SmtB family transcription factor [Paraburkholderia sp.]|uniref:ArsR/SmtB family transcription factor n=1 Tax=Paraburkholderia sp. TaxID=1926495 RepID=UPI003C7E14EC
MNTTIAPHPSQRFDALAEIARTLGHVHRLALLEHVAQGEHSVEQLSELSGLSIANASQHLQLLRRAGFVQTRRDGKRVLYRMASGPIANLLASLRDYAAHQHAEIQELVSDSINRPERLEGVPIKELLGRMADDSILLLDVRPEDEFALGHLPGAINIPAEELERHLGELPSAKEIVAYCRGPYCVLSTHAVAALRASGFNARRLEAGFPEWKAAGLRVEMSAKRANDSAN